LGLDLVERELQRRERYAHCQRCGDEHAPDSLVDVTEWGPVCDICLEEIEFD